MATSPRNKSSASRTRRTASKDSRDKKSPAKARAGKRTVAKTARKKAPGRKAPAATPARKKAPARKASKRVSAEPSRSAPALAEVDGEVLEFIAAIERFKEVNGRPFPSWSEVLLVLRQLGYKRS